MKQKQTLIFTFLSGVLCADLLLRAVFLLDAWTRGRLGGVVGFLVVLSGRGLGGAGVVWGARQTWRRSRLFCGKKRPVAHGFRTLVCGSTCGRPFRKAPRQGRKCLLHFCACLRNHRMELVPSAHIARKSRRLCVFHQRAAVLSL